ncbi:hypothetical protein [Mangrovibacterium lignilyticum]|uniref:hypothetical protein n=1 Tax=Mangrovibacterium lignilyticum TaxID=2668052 RepID=UPI0013CF84EC|nr:hypothetical protein [Mangrovibacterium lignilyticum]
MKLLVWLMIPLTIVTAEQVFQSPNCQILDSFESRFVDARNIHWQQYKNVWHADFNLGEQLVTACFDKKGNVLKIKTKIEVEELPITVRCAVHKNYPHYSIIGASAMCAIDFSGYEVKLRSDSLIVELNLTKWGELLEQGVGK